MFNKLLIANRGEVAVRIMRTCKKMNIRTVAVYSEADAESLHVKMADEAYLIGPSQVAKSYLNADKIVQVAVEAGVNAIHPGYGFLAESAYFARKCAAAGIVFVGPPADVIERMGSKIAARQAMEQAGVPVVPGISSAVEEVDEAVRTADHLGYPVMIKASAGGGGIGMQVAYNAKELRQTFAGNRQKAANYFGDGTMYVEKLIENARHIEIQLLADRNGNTVYLWERECSIQRRNQKVVEEAPSPFLGEMTRQRIGETAVKAAQAIGYVNAGTIEFLVDGDGQFYFLEMNTRLQVEHPVTEEITGLDIVELQLRIADGERLPFEQDTIKRNGHAIEVRIYAEDPDTFFPSPGTISKLSTPQGKNIRHELAVGEQSVVTPFYDPMIGKLIVRGYTRDEAIRRLQEALFVYEIEGIKTNIPFLRQIVAHPAFTSGETTTNFIQKHFK